MTRSPSRSDDQDETPKQRVNRELLELLNELRVALPGTQVLFAFLLVVPFQQGFRSLNDIQRLEYAGALVTTVAAIALLIAPSSYHRITFRRPIKEQMLFWSNRVLIAGMMLIMVGIVLSLELVLELAIGLPAAPVISIAAAAWFGWLWFVLPLQQRRASRDESEDQV
jgi:hypothetical protein